MHSWIILFVFSFVGIGCASVATTTHNIAQASCYSDDPILFSGTRYNMRPGSGGGIAPAFCFHLDGYLELPVDMAADTLLLPLTIPLAVSKGLSCPPAVSIPPDQIVYRVPQSTTRTSLYSHPASDSDVILALTSNTLFQVVSCDEARQWCLIRVLAPEQPQMKGYIHYDSLKTSELTIRRDTQTH